MKITVNKTVCDLYAYLKNTDADEIVIRTSRVKGGWHDNELDAQLAGFEISIFQNPEYEAKHQFAECYKLTRKE